VTIAHEADTPATCEALRVSIDQAQLADDSAAVARATGRDGAADAQECVPSDDADVCAPRAAVQLGALDGEKVAVQALLDTGAELCLVSPAIARRLKEHGVRVRLCARRLGTANGEVEVREWISCDLSVAGAVGREVIVPIEAGVQETGEELLLSYPVLRDAGLLGLLAAPRPGGPWLPAANDAADFEDGPDDFPPSNDGGDLVVEDRVGSVVDALLDDFRDLFEDLEPGEGARVPAMPVELLPGQSPRRHAPRRLSPAVQQQLDEEVRELLRAGVISPSSSSYASPIVMVRKKDGSRRMCVDYRSLNACTQDLKFPLPHPRSLLERLSGQRYFATLDLKSGFHQIPLSEEARPLTAFVTPSGLYEFNRIPFGLKNAPAFFQKTMLLVLSGLVGPRCQVFIDDIVVHGVNLADFAESLRLVLERLRQFGLRLKAAKCRFGLSQVEYLGHIVCGEGIALSDERKRAVAEVAVPTNTAQVRAFVGLANYFRDFIPAFATLARPLTALCSTKVQFCWGDGEQRAFDALKQAILRAPMLSHLDYDDEVILRTDASQVGIGGVLLQRDRAGRERPVCFISRAFTPAESRWSTIEQESFAVYHCMLACSHHLLGHRFTVETDHKNLMFLDAATAPKVVRWKLRLQEFDFTVRHIPGSSNILADGLSRCLPVAVQGRPPGAAHAEEIAAVHNGAVGHKGIKKTVELLRRRGVGWAAMENDVAQYIASCPVCQKVRLGEASFAATLRTTAVHEPFSVVAIDAVGPLPSDSHGNSFILVAIDCFSRFVELRAAPSTMAEDAARLLLDVFGRYGAPRFVRSDNGSQFTAKVVSDLLTLVGAERQLTIEYRPASNGIVERANAEVMRHLKSIVMERRVLDRWSEFLPVVQRVVNATPHSALGTSPIRMLFGDAVTADRGLVEERADGDEQLGVEEYVQRLNNAHAAVVAASDAHQQRVIDKRLAANDAAVAPRGARPAEGDYVLVSYPVKPPHKLAPRWRGPLVVLEEPPGGGSMFVCQDLRTLKIVRFHESRLKLFRLPDGGDPLQVAAVDQDEFVVESVVDHRIRDGGRPRRKADLEFRVRWLGYEPAEDSWLPYSEVRDLAALDAYALTHPELRL